MGRGRGALVPAVSMGLAALLGVLGAQPAGAAGSAYATWDLRSGEGPVTVPVAGFPAGAFSTDATSATATSGGTTYLAADTPFGQVFGSSRGRPYAVIRPAAGSAPSTTTISFARPAPASSWGFALGDVDADTVQVSATGADGSRVDVASLGYQGAFNYCGGTPKPASCGSGSAGDRPTWDPGTATLRGNGPDTEGASGWFRPTAAISSLTLRMTVLTGRPVYQVWLAALTRTVSGTLAGACDGRPATSTVRLLTGSGAVLAETTSEPDGSYAFASVAAGHYQVQVVPAEGFTVDGPATTPADTTSADAPDVDFALTCRPKPPTTTPPSPTSTTSPPPTDVSTTEPTSAQPTTTSSGIVVPPATRTTPNGPLATTGTSAGQWLGAGLLLVAVGTGLLILTARRRRTR
ncbi:SdrD B-like domain-containing protein [Amycolatopsis sp. NPDC047767]|uniref:SdrD B-like domain-containing protein n=1 Tax=Amycolatopsis sp. NPDC047767 TaxID=3156765 RepID=UPI00345397AE